MTTKLRVIIVVLLCFWMGQSNAQFGIGATTSIDFYNRYTNPEDQTGQHRSNGSVLLNFALGPKIWVGGENFSFSVETQVNLGLLGLSLPDYKGLGNISFPVIGKFNFAGLAGTNKEGRFGFSIGGGFQMNRTELLYVTSSFKEQGGEREYFKTYIVQAGYGFGISGFAAQLFGRYGFNPDLDGANSFNFGIQFDFNINKLRKIDDPNSRL